MVHPFEPEAPRACLRNELRIPYADVGAGRLICHLPEARLGCQPASQRGSQASGTRYIPSYCDDNRSSAAEVRARSVEFTDEISDEGYCKNPAPA